MQTNSNQPVLRPWPLGLVVVSVGLLLSTLLYNRQVEVIQQIEQARFAQVADELTDALSQRLDVYTEIALGLRSLFVVNPALGRSAFNDAAKELELDTRHPGIKNINFARYVLAKDKVRFEAQVRVDTSDVPQGYPEFQIHPVSDSPEYFVIDYLWPMTGNQGVHGLDISSQPANLATMHYSQQSGQLVASGPFDLVQETTLRTGFLIRVPVFRSSASTPRPADFLGAISVILRVYDLMEQLEREGHLKGLQLTLSDRGSNLPGLADDVNSPLFATPPNSFVSSHQYRRELNVFGRQWQLDFHPYQTFLSPSEQNAPLVAGLLGGLISLLLGALVLLLARSRAVALERASSQSDDLKDSEERWQFAIEGAGDGLWDWNLPQKRIFYSSRCKQMLGYSTGEVDDTLEEWQHRIHPEDLPKAVSAVREHLTGATKVYLDEHRIRCKDGSWKWVVDRGVVRSRDTAGRAVRMIGTVRDINARKLTELKMAEEHSLLMAVIDAIPMRVFWKDKQFNYMGCNSEFALDAGKQSPAEVVGQDDFKMGWATQADLYRADDQQVMDSGVVKLFYDEPQTTPQGQVIWLRTSKIPLKDQSGKIFGVLGIYEDISQRKQAEELVRKLSQVADQSPESVVIASLDANIEYVNVAFERNTGYSRAEVIGQNSRILHSNLTPENTFVGMWQALTQGQTWNGELFNRRKDGTLYTEWAVISPLRDDAGVVTHYVAVKEDITEKNRLAAELDAHRHDLELLVEQRTTELTTARQQADASNRSKSDFLANMSHEIRTPMNGVIGMADVLAQTSLTPEQRRMLSTINSSSMALLSILNDILDFSKIEAGKLDIEQIATPLREVVEGAAQVMLSTASRKNVEISLFIDPSLPEWIICDPTRLRQILLNLLGNALKFVSLRSGHAMLHVQPCTRPDGSSCLHLSVIDNGIGMSPNIVAKLFQPFVQADASTVRRFGGTGLGLSITQRLVDLLHGSISVQSTPGVGSEFTVELPLQVAAAPEGIKTRSLPDLHGIHVLCVNPSTACLTLFQTYLGSVGAQVIALPDMVAAHSLLNQPLQNNVLLLDLTQAGGADVNAQEHQRLELDTRVVRLVRRRTSDMPAHVIEVQAGPLLYHDLLQGVALASQRISITDMVVGTPQANASQRVAPSVAAAIQAGQLILLAEDNETNRDVMGAQLHLLGYACEMAFDGERALSMWRNGLGSNDESGRYAMLLTDCHMPNLDGFELAKAIRQSEPEGSHLPIIAITANAMQGEAERCHDRGMDGYLCKPLRLQELGDILNKWLPLADLTPAGEPPQQLVEFTTSLAIWNPETLAEIVGNNPAVHQRLLKKFLLNADKQCKQITGAMKAADLTTLALLAHTLKSAARAVGALALGELCQNIETAGNAQDHAACSAWTSDLDDTLAAAAQRIRPHLGDDISLAIESMDS